MAVQQGLGIYDVSGNQLHIITDYYDGEWTQGVNVADELRFVVPTATAPAGLIHFNEVWLKRGDNAELVRKFVISDIIERQGHREETEVICYDYISLLGRDEVTGVPDPAFKDMSVNVLQYLNELLSLQSSITWGTLPPIASDLTYPYDDLYVANTFILPSLHRLRDYIGGMLWVDNNKKLHWYKKRFPNPPQAYTLELGRNTISVKRRDNRLHAGVEGEISYEVEVVDLSQESGEDDGMLNIGMPVTLDGTTVYITDIKQYLGNPLALTINVSTSMNLSGRPPDALDYLVSLENRALDLERYRSLYGDKISSGETRLDDIELALEPLEEYPLDEIITDIEDLQEDVITLEENPAVTAGNDLTMNDPDTGIITTLLMGKVVSLDEDGDNIMVSLYNYRTETWVTEPVHVLKPPYLQASFWEDETIEYTDGREIAYDATDLDKTYQRRATWTEDEEELTEVQEITAPYAVDEVLLIFKLRSGQKIDANNAGRHYAALEEV